MVKPKQPYKNSTLTYDKRATFHELEQLRWGLVERKYSVGLNKDEHDRLDFMSWFCWEYRKRRGAN